MEAVKNFLTVIVCAIIVMAVISSDFREKLKTLGMLLLAGFIYFATYPPGLDPKTDMAILSAFAVIVIAAAIVNFIRGR